MWTACSEQLLPRQRFMARRQGGPDAVQAALAALNLPGSKWLAGGQDDWPRVREKFDVLLENDMTAGSRVVKGSS